MRHPLLSFFICCFMCIALLKPTYANSSIPFVKRSEVKTFIAMMAEKHQFKKTALEKLFAEVKIRPQVMRQMNKPLEKESWRTYQMLFVNEWRIEHGLKFWNKYKNALEEAEKTYGVPASIIVATIGIETKYGQRVGDHRVIDALCNIAFSDSPRAHFFQKELIQFLLLTREQHLNPLKVIGSYAGAIGQPQFMPSSYRHYAVNFSKSGKIDLMNNEIDVIGSIANYYQKNGWKNNQPIVIPAVTTSTRYAYFLRNNPSKNLLTLNELEKYDIFPKNTALLAGITDQLKVRVIPLSSRYHDEYWLGFHNFAVIKRYNSSDLYAMAVYQLSFYISSLKEKLHNG